MTVNLEDIRSVLVVKPSSLGDVVHTLPAVAFLKRQFPHLAIRWVVNSEWAPLLKGNPDIESAVLFPRREFQGAGSWPAILGWARGLRIAGRPDLALDFQGLLRSALICKASGARAIAGLSDAREGAGFLHRTKVEIDPAAHAVDRYLALVRALGVDTSGELVYPLPAGEPPDVESGKAPGDACVVLHPFSRGEGKSFTPAQVAAICRGLAPHRVVVAGVTGAEDVPLPGNAVNLLNRTSLPQLIHLLRGAVFTISVDSGPMHISAALTGQLLGVHTWSDPRRVGPHRGDAWVWKGGRICRVSDLEPVSGAADDGTRGFPDSGIEGLCAFVGERIHL